MDELRDLLSKWGEDIVSRLINSKQGIVRGAGLGAGFCAAAVLSSWT